MDLVRDVRLPAEHPLQLLKGLCVCNERVRRTKPPLHYGQWPFLPDEVQHGILRTQKGGGCDTSYVYVDEW